MRTGKRSGKTSLTARHGRDLARAIAECRYLLRDLNPDGVKRAAGRVGLITHKDCEQAMAEALGILEQRRGHFWGMRESLRLEDCTLLLVVGPHAVQPEQVARLARAYYRDDPEPMDETAAPDAEGRWRYRDKRMQRVADALVQAELTRVGAPQPADALRRPHRGDASRQAISSIYPLRRSSPACRSSRRRARRWPRPG